MADIVITVQKHQKCTAGRRHEKQPVVSKNVIPQFSRSVFSAYSTDFILGAAIQDAQIQIAAGVVDCPVPMIRVEDTMCN